MSDWAPAVPLEEMRDGMLGIRAGMLTALVASTGTPAAVLALRETLDEIWRRGNPEDARVGFLMFMPER